MSQNLDQILRQTLRGIYTRRKVLRGDAKLPGREWKQPKKGQKVNGKKLRRLKRQHREFRIVGPLIEVLD